MKKGAKSKQPPALPKFSAMIEAKLAAFPAMKQINLRITLAKYARGKTAGWEERKLGEAGLIDAPAAAAWGPGIENDICYSQESLAVRMKKHYTDTGGNYRLKIDITKKIVSAWVRGERDQHVEPNPGPIKGTKFRYSFSAWVRWFDKNLLAEKLKVAAPLAGTPATPAASNPPPDEEEDFTVMEQRDKRDAIKHRRWERDKERGEYVHRSIALATGIAAVKKLHLMVKVEDERSHTKLRREKLLELGAAADLVEKFCEWDKDQMRQATDRREVAMEEAGMAIEIPATNTN